MSWLLVATVGLSSGCGQTSKEQQQAPEVETGGSAGAGAGGRAGEVGGNAGAGAGGRAPEVVESCPEVPTAHVGASAALDLDAEVFLEGSALSAGQPHPLSGGGQLTPSALRFYVSHVALLRADGSSTPADLVAESGAPEPYGLKLVNLDDDSSLRVRLLGPPGDYTGISFLLGLDDECNSGSQERKAPLSATSGMLWPPPFGYLFFRYEGKLSAVPSETEEPPSAIHMGGLVGTLLAPVVTAPGNLSLSDDAPAKRKLRLQLDEVFAAALAPTDLSDFQGAPGGEVEIGERLRRTAPSAPLFVLVEP